jgi:lipopolysaccharide transport system ATP-binding protein
MSAPLIEARGIGKRYRRSAFGRGICLPDLSRVFRRVKRNQPPDDFWALKDIDLELKQGDSLGIIGPNGAGKSTLLKILSRVTAPTEGVLKVRGRVGALIEVGAGFHPELSGRDNIYINGAILGMSRREIQKRFDEIVDFAEIEEFIDTPVKKYSSGMYVRLGFAVAASMDPEVLLVDEVLAVGDVRFQKKCIEKMEQYRESGTAVVLVSHNLANIVNNAKRAVLVEKGRIVEDGDPADICGRYLQMMMSGQKDGPEQYIPGASFGTMDVEIDQVRLLDGELQETSQFRAGDPLNITFSYVNRSGEEFGISAVTIHDMDGREVFRVQSDWTGQVMKLAQWRGEFSLAIPNLSVPPADYYVTVAVKDRTGNTVLHVLYEAWKIKVTSDNFTIGSVYLPHTWHHRESAESA